MKLKLRQICTHLKRNKRLLSGQAWNVERSLGLGKTFGIIVWQNDKFTIYSAVRGYHVYQDVWKPAAGQKLHAEQEFDNLMDKLQWKSRKIAKRSPICLANILIFSLTWLEVTVRRRHCKQLCRGMEIPCRLVCKVKLNRLKELLENKIRRCRHKHCTNSSFRSHHWYKSQ